MVEKYKITKKEEVFNLLKNKRNFNFMSESLLRRLINEMKVIRFTQKTLLIKQETENRFIYIIIKGSVTVYVDKKPLYTLRRTGDVFGELSFATKKPSTASIVAEEGLGVMAISFNFLKKLNDIELGFWLCNVLGEKLVRTSKLKAIRTTENIDELEADAPADEESTGEDEGELEIDDALGDETEDAAAASPQDEETAMEAEDSSEIETAPIEENDEGAAPAEEEEEDDDDGEIGFDASDLNPL
jgi:cyclic nucleotide-binding protein